MIALGSRRVVHVGVTRSPSSAWVAQLLREADTGKGIREELLGKVFAPFFTTKAKGTGLGLAISRQLIEQHGGTIGVETRTGGGARFTIQLPVAARDEAPA